MPSPAWRRSEGRKGGACCKGREAVEFPGLGVWLGAWWFCWVRSWSPCPVMAEQLRVTDFFPRGKGSVRLRTPKTLQEPPKLSLPSTPKDSGQRCLQAPLGSSRKRRRGSDPQQREGAGRAARRRLLMPAEEQQQAVSGWGWGGESGLGIALFPQPQPPQPRDIPVGQGKKNG